jgi:hypothetical protein
MKENYIMAYVTYSNRTSQDYRFTVDSLDDPAIADFKAIITKRNGYITRARKKYGITSYWGKQNTQGLRIRARGPRGRRYGYDTPVENATRFDVYVREYK